MTAQVHVWTKSACVVLAWSILFIGLVAVGMKVSVRPAQASTRIASSTAKATLASTLTVAAARRMAAPPTRYAVQPGDTLSGIAARFAVPGGWQALYAANRPLIGPDPDIIQSGTVLVLPRRSMPARYTVAADDTLAGIAAVLAVPGGWPALYAANKRVIGPDPNVIRPGTVLTVARAARPSPSGPRRRLYPVPPPAGSRHRSPPVRTGAPAAAGMPQWLKTMLLAVGLVIGAALLAASVLLIRKRRRRVATRAATPSGHGGEPVLVPPPRNGQGPACGPHPARSGQGPAPPPPRSGQGPACGPPPSGHTRIVVADYDRVVVTYSQADDTVYVLRPPGSEPDAILRAARLVLPEDPYEELAEQLGVPAGMPMR